MESVSALIKTISLTSPTKLQEHRAAFQELAQKCTVGKEIQLSEVQQALVALVDQLRKHLPLDPEHRASFYYSLLEATAVLLAEAKGNHGLNVATFLDLLRPFWTYGVLSRTQAMTSQSRRPSQCLMLNHEAAASQKKTYQPPHMRARRSASNSDARLSESESDASDTEGAWTGRELPKSYKARLAALACLQALAKWDPKALHPVWLTLLPTCAPLAMRPQDATLLDVLNSDPSVKVRLATGGAIAALFDGPQQKAFLAVAERRNWERQPVRGFTTLSSSLGEMAIATHQGLLMAIGQESSVQVLASSLRALTSLVSAAPYHRLPEDLPLQVIQVLQLCLAQSHSGSLSSRANVQMVQAAVLACMAAVFGGKTPLPAIVQYLCPTGEVGKSGCQLVAELLQRSQSGNGIASQEGLGVLRAIAYNYPQALVKHWRWIVQLALRHATDFSPAPENEGLMTMLVLRVISTLLSSSASSKAVQGAAEGADTSSHRQGSVTKAADVSWHGTRPGAATGTYTQATPSETLCSPQMVLEACSSLFPQVVGHRSAMVRAAAWGIPGACSVAKFGTLPQEVQHSLFKEAAEAVHSDTVPAVRAAVAKALGQMASFVHLIYSSDTQLMCESLDRALGDDVLSVQVQAASAAAALAHAVKQQLDEDNNLSANVGSVIERLIPGVLKAAESVEKVSVSGIRALGGLLASAYLANFPEGKAKLGNGTRCFKKALSQGGFKTQWNACFAVGTLLRIPDVAREWASSGELPDLLHLLCDIAGSSPSFKSRMHAAAALTAVPHRRLCLAAYQDICTGLAKAVDMAEDPGLELPLQSSTCHMKQTHEQVDFKLLASMRLQLQAALQHFLSLPD